MSRRYGSDYHGADQYMVISKDEYYELIEARRHQGMNYPHQFANSYPPPDGGYAPNPLHTAHNYYHPVTYPPNETSLPSSTYSSHVPYPSNPLYPLTPSIPTYPRDSRHESVTHYNNSTSVNPYSSKYILHLLLMSLFSPFHKFYYL